jgi:hypothetical protein
MNTFLAATYHPAERPSREEKKKQKKKEAAMKDETSILPTRSQSKQSHSSTSSRTSSNPSAASVARSRPALAARNNSAPSVPLNSTSTNTTTTTTSTIRDPKVVDADDLPNLHSHSHRDSVASIKDDPFFRNYQSPHSVSLNREMMAASYEEDDDDDDDEDDSPLEPLSRSSKRPSVDDSVNLPVRISCSLEEPPKLT